MKKLILVIILLISPITESNDMKTEKILDNYLQLLTEITKDYIRSTRQWKYNEYVVKFHYVDTKKHSNAKRYA